MIDEETVAPVEDVVKTVRDPFTPTPKQAEFFAACDISSVEEVLFDGSIRGGKTQACCKKLIAWAWTYGGRYLIVRKTYRELRDSTMAVLLRGEGDLPPACPHGLFRGGTLQKAYRASDDVLYLANGAEIMFRSVENVEDAKAKLRNLSLNAAFIDQVEELDDPGHEELYEELLGRLSDPRGPGKMLLAANPGPQDHWVYKRFIDEETRKDWTRHIHVTLFDNQGNLDKRYLESRLRTKHSNPDYYKRFILGEWGAFGGKRFKSWKPGKHVVDSYPIPSWWETFEAIDYGWHHPFCCLAVGVSPEGHYVIFAEHYDKERSLGYHVARIKEMRQQYEYSPSVTWIDPSTARRDLGQESIQIELADLGMFVAPAQNERLGGWARMDEMLTTTLPDGKPQLTVFNNCRNLVREIPSARIKDGTDDIEKRNDHALDALRYAIMSRPPIPNAPDEPEFVDLRETYARDLHRGLDVPENLYLGV